MKLARYALIGCLGLSLAACDKATKTPAPSTPLQAREPVVAIALGGGGAKGFAHIGYLKSSNRMASNRRLLLEPVPGVS